MGRFGFTTDEPEMHRESIPPDWDIFAAIRSNRFSLHLVSRILMGTLQKSHPKLQN
jgi:hypothetical protein